MKQRYRLFKRRWGTYYSQDVETGEALYPSSPQSLYSCAFCKDCGGQLTRRVDDREDVVRKRFKSFERETRPVIEFFRNNFGPCTSEYSAALPQQQKAHYVWHFLQATVPGISSELKQGPAHTPENRDQARQLPASNSSNPVICQWHR